MPVDVKAFTTVLVKYGTEFRSISVIENEEDGVWIVGEISWKSLCEVGTSALACRTEYNLHRLAFFNFFRRAAALHASPQYLRRLVPMIAFLQLPQGRIFTHAR